MRRKKQKQPRLNVTEAANAIVDALPSLINLTMTCDELFRYILDPKSELDRIRPMTEIAMDALNRANEAIGGSDDEDQP